jgi:hypothetical protein
MSEERILALWPSGISLVGAINPHDVVIGPDVVGVLDSKLIKCSVHYMELLGC